LVLGSNSATNKKQIKMITLEIPEVKKLIKQSKLSERNETIKSSIVLSFGSYRNARELIRGCQDNLTIEQIQSKLNNYLSEDQKKEIKATI
jgi:hypothetical protein